ncbi:MAG TPA: cupredoxin domain-containing protein [Actinomycetota bacterium]
MHTKPLVVAAVAAFALLTVACGDGSDVGSGTEQDPRTIEVTALDDPAFDPSTIEVAAGETVRFVVTNTGEADHEFVVGDMEMQEMAEEQAMEGMHGHAQAMAALALEPDATAETVLTFEEAGELFYGCHVDGHYEAGMVGTITVT